MRIEELSVGDWVCAKLAKWESEDADTTPPLQVKRINGIERHNLYVDLFNPTTNTIEHSAFVGDLVPIPLTPEILEKNGFEIADEFADYQMYGNPECSIVHTKGTMHYRLEAPQASVVCWNVHQLQRAMKLAGIEKEIEV